MIKTTNGLAPSVASPDTPAPEGLGSLSGPRQSHCQSRHSRASGNPESLKILDPIFMGMTITPIRCNAKIAWRFNALQ